MPTNSLAVLAAFFLRTVSVRAIAFSTGHAFDPVRPFATTMVPQDEQRLEATMVEEDTHGHVDLSTLVYPTEYIGHFKSLLIPADAIRQRVDVLAGLLAADYSGKRPVLVCTLKGACPFFVHLCDALQSRRIGYDLEFVRASSYDGTDSTGTVAILGELKIDSLKDRHVIIVEDIVDTGTTLSTLVPLLQARGGPASVQVCSLVDKRLADPSHKQYTAKYVGFSVPNAFIIGYGLDYNECYRDLKDIFVISQKGIEFDSNSLRA